MTAAPDKPKTHWPPSFEAYRISCTICPNAKDLTFEELARRFGVSVTTLGEWIAAHCKKIDEDTDADP